MWRTVKSRPFTSISAVTGVGITLYYCKSKLISQPILADMAPPSAISFWLPPSRKDILQRLKGYEKGNKMSESDVEFDLLIIGGGATGAGCALDATTRGLKVALVERDDFSCGTSSRSTKLIHGGVRYLEKAFWDLDYDQYKLVKEALHERGAFMTIAPYLAHEIPIMLPLMTWWKLPYYYLGAKVYDLLAGSQGLSQSYFLTKTRAIEAFPMLKKDRVAGAIVYYDGMHNDARMNTAIALTAIQHGAAVANHVQVESLVKKQVSGKVDQICGAVVKDMLTGETWTIKAKGVVNATGPFCDSIRKMDTGIETKEIVAPSAGVHLVLPSYFSPRNMGLLDPNTSDGRVIFFLPWQGSVIAGTTDSPTLVDNNPIPSEKDITWILKEVANYLSPDIKLRRGDVQAAWAGIRPLVRDPNAKNTESLVRNHMVNVSEAGLLTIAGGKWTTYRAMAEDCIDEAIRTFGLKPTGPCVTATTLLLGSHQWHENLFIKLIQHFGIETEVASHLASNYGDRAWSVASMASLTGSRYPIYGNKLAMGYPYIEAEVRYACRHEYACTVVDVLARRLRLAFLNAQSAQEAIPRVVEIMANELGWDEKRKKLEYEQTHNYLLTMGLKPTDIIHYPTDSVPQPLKNKGLTNLNVDTAEAEAYFTKVRFFPEELQRYKQIFNSMDSDNDGQISQTDFRKILQKVGLEMQPDEMKRVIAEVDLDKSGTIEFNEFLMVVAAVKDIRSRSKFARIVAEFETREQFPTDRSGGGV